MHILMNIRRGRGAFYSAIKRTVVRLLGLHLAVNGATRPLFAACYWFHVSAREFLCWLCRFCWYEPLFRSQCSSVGKAFRMEQLPYIVGRGNIRIGDNVQFSGKPAFTFNNQHFDAPDLTIGNGTFLGHRCSFRIGRSLQLGSRCAIASHVSICDCDGHPLDAAKRCAGEAVALEDIKPVVIGDDVWIGAGATILKGVTIGDRAVIGARAVVTKDVPPDAVVVGNPAQVVKYLRGSSDWRQKAEQFPATIGIRH